MLSKAFLYAVLAFTFLGLGACATAPMEEVSVEELRHVPGDLSHDWSEVFSTSNRGDDTGPVGYLDRRFSEEDPEGKVFVLDRLHREKGFILPGGKAFVFKFDHGRLVGARDLGNTGFENGVKKILQVAGGVKWQRVTASSKRPAKSDPQG